MHNDMYMFVWDTDKNLENIDKHGITFWEAEKAFYDKRRIIKKDESHSIYENRFFCIGKTAKGILTVRYTYRGNRIRIIGAGNWRKGRKLYEEKNKIH